MKNIFKDKDGIVVIGQSPNPPIIGAFIFWLLSKVSNEPINKNFYILFLGFLLWWAVLEIFQGVNIFRKLLGTLVFVFIIYSFARLSI